MLTTSPQDRLDEYLRQAPQWAVEASRSDATVNRVMKHSAHAGDTTEAMLWRLAGAMYEQRNCWKATALEAAERQTVLITNREEP